MNYLVQTTKMIVTNGSKKRCREKFNDIKGINKVINSCVKHLESYPTEIIIAEEIYDYDDITKYNVLLFLMLDNCKDEKILKELSKFDFKNNKK